MVNLRKTAQWINRIIWLVIVFIIVMLPLSASAIPYGDQPEQVRSYTRDKEFNFIEWTLDALNLKLTQSSLDVERFVAEADTKQIIQDYLQQVSEVNLLSNQIEIVFADPAVSDPVSDTEGDRKLLNEEKELLRSLAEIAEPILQNQVSAAIANLSLSVAGQVLPPVAYHVTPLPLNLVVSPRKEISRITEVSLVSGMDAQEKDALEQIIFTELDLSAIVVPIGGMSAYPTMIMQTTDLAWLLEVIAHEWIHTYLAFYPLGMNYSTSGEMRTINETTASLAGKEISLEVLREHYPEWMPTELVTQIQAPPTDAEPPAFDFRAEMRITRETTDRLLAEGKIEDAEGYMEMRRQFFWDNGYLIRKINQAYFAFYGAYNDEPGGGASGSDPVGPLVQELRSKSMSLAEFVKTIAKVNTYQELIEITAAIP